MLNRQLVSAFVATIVITAGSAFAADIKAPVAAKSAKGAIHHTGVAKHAGKVKAATKVTPATTTVPAAR